MKNDTTLLVTMALPYANGDIHLGHIVEAVITDAFVRYSKMTGRKTLYVCADDTHGTPIELNALKLGITCEQLIEKAWLQHVTDYKPFSIQFDTYYSTNSLENRQWAEFIYKKLCENNYIEQRKIEQFYCTSCMRFLPDRFIVGTCPKCQATKQYGDVCEACGVTYDPVELSNQECIICTNKPELRSSDHYFVNLAKAVDFLRAYVSTSTVLQQDMRNFVLHWIDDGLKQWCISRDGPYFGFKIPGTENKFFYVWLDAPIGYISATEKWCKDNGADVSRHWNADSSTEIIHVIGKDIVYFHTLFWPVMLHVSSLKLPTKFFVHGFLTVNGEKMSKSRGTFISARQYIEKVKHPAAADMLRLYFCSKLAGTAADLDLNTQEFCVRVNTLLVNTIGNFHHRTSVFLDRYFNSHVPDAAWDPDIAKAVEAASQIISQSYTKTDYKTVIDQVQQLANCGNKYYQDMKPWSLIASDSNLANQVMVTCVNLIRSIAVFLKPIIPSIVLRIEQQYSCVFQWSDYSFSLRNCMLGHAEKIATPIEKEAFDALFPQNLIQPNLPGTQHPSVKNNPDTHTIDQVDINDFKKIQMKIGTILTAQPVEGSDKLIQLTVNDGIRKRTIVAGIAKHYTPLELINKQIVFVANLKPATIRGIQSEGMVLTANKGKTMRLLQPDDTLPEGALIS